MLVIFIVHVRESELPLHVQNVSTRPILRLESRVVLFMLQLAHAIPSLTVPRRKPPET
jgi:hypothetical protein